MGARRLLDSFTYAMEGIVYALKTQRNMRIHLVAAAVVLSYSFFARITRLELILVILAVTMVIICELINTAIEKTVDIATQEFHPIAKIAKDVAAGAVLVSALCSAVVGYLVFFSGAPAAKARVIDRVRESLSHITFVNLAAVLLAVVIIKYLFHSKNILHGGMPSGHAAAAFSFVTIIWLNSSNAYVCFIALILGILVLQSRVETGVHSLLEVLLGALLGIALTYFIFNLLSR